LKKKNHLLETAKQNLADQDRLVSLGMLSAGLAHELNTPLSVLHGSVEKLLETTRDSVTIERLQRMLRVTERLRGISESLIDFARARTQKVETIFLQPIVDEAWSLIQIEPDAASIKFYNLLDKEDYVIGNSDRLLQVFVNLLRNSVNALEGSGTIKVSALKKFQNGRDWLIVTVEDDGCGIDPEILPLIFEPFVTTRLDARGTGLGLAVAEGIIHQHGGVILASNHPSGGACFEITLPSSPKEISDEQSS
jgi:signal transduction histidine kinase